ncbi:MAG TPA: hemolysin family protein [Planctomycetota bacterium]|nr:hemolysin family protein [Planctomycetota bacterium]
MNLGSIAGFDVQWLLAALAALLGAMYVAVSRQALAIFSRKTLLERAPEDRRPEIENHLDHVEGHISSLRTLDLILRLALVLSLAFSRWTNRARTLPESSFLQTLGECVILALEILAIVFVFLEIVPAIIARVAPEATVARRLRTTHRLHTIISPLRTAAGATVRWIASLLGGEVDRPSADILEEEILSAAEEGERGGLIGSRDIDMIESIITFGNVEVSQVMTPRTEMVCFDLEDPLEGNIQRAVECGHSRIPVFRDSKDNIVGILYVKDLLRYWDRRDSVALEQLARKPHFVALTKKIGELFQEFKTQRFHIAIVLDEFGGTAGLLTIEDIIEEIVGEITDEHEKIDRPPLKRIGPGVAEVDGAYHIDDLNDQLGTAIPEADTYDTVGGFLASQMGKIPSVGETYELDSLRFEVIAADERRIRRLKLSFADEARGSPPPAVRDSANSRP